MRYSRMFHLPCDQKEFIKLNDRVTVNPLNRRNAEPFESEGHVCIVCIYSRIFIVYSLRAVACKIILVLAH